MSNPLIVVNSAFYGTPDIAPVDVTSSVQHHFDTQFQKNGNLNSFSIPVTNSSFGIPDPSPGNLKTLSISYNIPGSGQTNNFFRGGNDGQTLTIMVQPFNEFVILAAFYGTGQMGLDVTQKMIEYLTDPGNSTTLVIGDQLFFNALTDGSDPSRNERKYFSVSFQKPPSTDVINMCGFDGQTINLDLDLAPPNQTWMYDLFLNNPGFGNLPLSQICLPASHDSGSYEFGSTYTEDKAAVMAAMMNTVTSISNKLNIIPHISDVLDPLTWVKAGILNVTKDISTTTTRTVLQQLNDGIRCLDLRIYYNHNDPNNPFYSYHGLVGVPLTTIFSDIAFFITFQAKKGEILYVTMGHFQDDNSDTGNFNSNQTAQFKSFVLGYFDHSQLFGPSSTSAKSLFDCSYDEIVSSGGSDYGSVYLKHSSSKIILVMEDAIGDEWIWSNLEYSPPDANSDPIPSGFFEGVYLDTDSRSKMLSDQQLKSRKAKIDKMPFALYLTLTPQPLVATFLMVRAIQLAVLALVPAVFLIPIIGLIVGPLLLTFETSLLAEIVGNSIIAANYTSLKELTKSIYHGHDLSKLMQKYFTGSDYAFPSFIYLDFFEEHTTVNVDGKKVVQVVEIAKMLTLNNL